MKLLSKKKRKIAVFFTGGLGDALLYIPLLSELQKKQFTVTCIFYSKYDNDCIFDESLYDSKVQLNTKLSLLLFAFSKLRYFANIYINHLGAGKAVITAAKICSKRITQTKTTGATGASQKIIKRNRTVIPDLTDAEQNLYLLFSKQNSIINRIEDLYLPHPDVQPGLVKKFTGAASSYFVVQVSAGNNTTPFKNWPMKYWLNVVTLFCSAYKHLDLVILGDNTETGYVDAFNDLGFTNCKVLIGKTSVEELFNIVAKSNGYIGLDSGIMHMAAVLQKKTVTIFGASNENIYGYSKLDAADHRLISSAISCRPCSSWKNANTSRVTNPMQCPDFACLGTIDPLFVFQQVVQHFNL
jgi:ADP-heptose:LPS heptosyltransferase